MIIKGKARSGPAQLAAYLMRSDERAALLHLDYGDGDLRKAFIEWDSIGELTRGEKTLYHAQIAPEAKYGMTPEQWRRAAEILAEELGMKDHPLAIVVHGGGGQPHAHVVICRTDTETLTMWDDSYNYVKHERASHRMEQEFGHEIVPGKHAKRDRKKQPEFPRQAFDQAEAQQAKRQGVDPEERKQQITALRQSCDSGEAFKNALEEAGYILARGRRPFVLVDQDGEDLSLSRQVLDLDSKKFKKFMADVDPATLPTVDEAKALQEQRALARKETRTEGGKQASETPQFPEPQPPAPEPKPAPAPQDEELEQLKKKLAARQATDVQKWADFHAHELVQLEFELGQEHALKLAGRDATDKDQMDALKDRLKEERSGWKGFVAAIEARWNPKLAADKRAAQRKEIRDLKRRQERERKDYETLLKQTRQQEIDNLQERQRQKMVDLAFDHEKENERYIREHHEAGRIRADIAEQERLEEELKHNDSLRDGPPPPKLGKP